MRNSRYEKQISQFIEQRTKELKLLAEDLEEIVTEKEVEETLACMDVDDLVLPGNAEPIVVGILPLLLDNCVIPVRVYSDCSQEIPKESGSNGLCQTFSTVTQLEYWARNYYLPGIWVYDHDKGCPKCLRTGVLLPQARRYVRSA